MISLNYKDETQNDIKPHRLCLLSFFLLLYFSSKLISITKAWWMWHSLSYSKKEEYIIKLRHVKQVLPSLSKIQSFYLMSCSIEDISSFKTTLRPEQKARFCHPIPTSENQNKIVRIFPDHVTWRVENNGCPIMPVLFFYLERITGLIHIHLGYHDNKPGSLL